jgi:Flagellar regulatory protein FleQ.
MTARKSRKVLLIDSDVDRSNKIGKLFEFIEYEPHVCDSETSALTQLEANDYLGLFCVDLFLSQRVIEKLTGDDIPLPPYVLMADDTSDDSLMPELSKPSFAIVKKELNTRICRVYCIVLNCFLRSRKVGVRKPLWSCFEAWLAQVEALAVFGK